MRTALHAGTVDTQRDTVYRSNVHSPASRDGGHPKGYGSKTFSITCQYFSTRNNKLHRIHLRCAQPCKQGRWTPEVIRIYPANAHSPASRDGGHPKRFTDKNFNHSYHFFCQTLRNKRTRPPKKMKNSRKKA